jgi:hypothetical protein
LAAVKRRRWRSYLSIEAQVASLRRSPTKEEREEEDRRRLAKKSLEVLCAFVFSRSGEGFTAPSEGLKG